MHKGSELIARKQFLMAAGYRAHYATRAPKLTPFDVRQHCLRQHSLDTIRVFEATVVAPPGWALNACPASVSKQSLIVPVFETTVDSSLVESE